MRKWHPPSGVQLGLCLEAATPPGPHVERAPETPAVPGLPQPSSGPVPCRRLALCLAMQPQGPGDLGQSRTRLTDRVGVALT